MKRMSKIAALCLTAGSMFLAPLSADTCCAPQECCSSSGSWELGIELLYWKPCVCAFEYAHVFDDPLREVQRVKPSGHPGWRLFAAYAPCDSCASYLIDWTYLRATDSSEINTPEEGTLEGFDLPFGSQVVQGQVRAIYNRINLRMNYTLHCGDCVEFYTYGGFRLLDFNLHKRTTGLQSNGSELAIFRTKSQFSGAGIELGVGGRYDLGCCIGLVTNVGIGAAVGQQKYNTALTNIQTPGSSIVRRYASQTHCVPSLDLRIGFDYEWACECFTTTFELGYEINHYFNALRDLKKPSGNRSIAGNEITGCRDFGVAGPYASLRIAY